MPSSVSAAAKPRHNKSQKPTSSSSANNDDSAERRERRQSLVDDRRKRRKSQLLSPMSPAMNNQGQNDGNESGKMMDVERVPLHTTVSIEEMTRRYEEWMKIAADNKINANNSWNLALIDYFHDMSILRDGDSVNFQKASCTLDGCVKIYTSRVDSVDSETRKLLNGLTENVGRSSNKDGDDMLDNEDGEGEVTKKRRAHRSGDTLEKDFASLNIKKFDLEFMVDPLFKKTSADFDEGGARGLLLNHLNVFQNGRIIFDASDAIADSESGTANEVNDVVPVNMIDISRIKAQFNDLICDLWSREVCPSLKSFEFNSSNSSTTDLFDPTLFENFNAQNDDNNDAPAAADDEEDPYAPDPNYNNDYDGGYGGYDDDDDGGYSHDGDMASVHGGDMVGNDGGITGAGVEGLPGRNFVVNMKENDDDMFSYFDAQMLRSWAGPEHYRMRPLRMRGANGNNAANNAAASAEPKRRKGKEPFTIDFINGEELSDKVIFARSSASINLKIEKNRSRNLLPEDTHFTSKDMLGLFLKPKCTVKFKKNNVVRNERIEGAVDEQFWAERRDDQIEFGDDNDLPPGDGDYAAFNNYNDDDNDMPVAEVFNDDSPPIPIVPMEDFPISQPEPEYDPTLDYGSQLVAEPKRVKATHLNYARSAKRVDVHELKENIWKELIEGPPSLPNSPVASPRREPARAATPMSPSMSMSQEQPIPSSQGQKEHKFTDVVLGLKKFYPQQKLKDISVPFCFICLLHLANEQNLTIENTDGQLQELKIMQN